jgi:hypothetical protein
MPLILQHAGNEEKTIIFPCMGVERGVLLREKDINYKCLKTSAQKSIRF